ncbi:flavin reductase family protein [Kineococcus sp. SYSU DK001]|uniref:flavin reductase family protein n=1 Tax=Kineococcus sp. SYSU DK001 TaxID=3383122 RepID=UPI003D7C584C
MNETTERVLTPVEQETAALRQVFAQFPTGVAALSLVPEDDPRQEPVVFIASSFQVGISLDPPLVLVAVQHTSTSWPKLRAALDRPGSRVGVTVLADHHEAAVRRLASKALSGHERFDGLTTTTRESGAHYLNGSPAWMECSLHSQFPAGDHDVVLLRVHDSLVDTDAEPLVWHASGFRGMSPRLTPAG